MWLNELSVLNFKNYEEAELTFTPKVNALTGDNGAGKTNLLDAIHYLSLCKSYFNPIDSQHIAANQDWFMVQGCFNKAGNSDQISCSIKRNQKKKFQRNKKAYERLSEHIGQFPLVMVSPNDIALVLEGSEVRRKFIDNVISQSDSQYVDKVLRYNRHLQNRNSILKEAAKSGKLDTTLLEVLDDQLIELGEAIYECRKTFLAAFIPIFNESYKFLSDKAESVSLIYHSQLEKVSFKKLLSDSLPKDRILERTTVGIHKDDLVFSVNGLPLKRFGSQGQQKSFLISLKLAQYTYLHEKKEFKPLLLLDDIFDKLDDKRITKLMELVSKDRFGQIFITHTNSEILKGVFREIEYPLRVFQIDNGRILKMIDYEPK